MALNEGVDTIKNSYEPYQKNCFFTKYAKWVNSFIKMAYLTNCITLKEKYLHCPIDETVLAAIGDKNTIWSKADKEEYYSIIQNINTIRDKKTIFLWELERWNNFKLGG